MLDCHIRPFLCVQCCVLFSGCCHCKKLSLFLLSLQCSMKCLIASLSVSPTLQHRCVCVCGGWGVSVCGCVRVFVGVCVCLRGWGCAAVTISLTPHSPSSSVLFRAVWLTMSSLKWYRRWSVPSALRYVYRDCPVQ